MVTSNILWGPPAAFDFKKTEVLYCFGEEGEDVLQSVRCDEKAKKKYSEVMGAFEAFFSVHRNLIFKRARTTQAEGKSVEQYVVALYSLTRNCTYGQLTEELI